MSEKTRSEIVKEAEIGLAWAKTALLTAVTNRDNAVRAFQQAEAEFARAAEKLGRLAYHAPTPNACATPKEEP